MRRTHPGGRRRIRTGLDRLKAVAALGIAVLDSEALEVGIEWRGVRITRVGVAPVSVGLPKLDPRPFQRLPLDVHDSPHDIDHLARGAAWLTRHGSQIGGFLHRSENWIERPEDFAWSAFQRLGEH